MMVHVYKQRLWWINLNRSSKSFKIIALKLQLHTESVKSCWKSEEVLSQSSLRSATFSPSIWPTKIHAITKILNQKFVVPELTKSFWKPLSNDFEMTVLKNDSHKYVRNTKIFFFFFSLFRISSTRKIEIFFYCLLISSLLDI